MKKTYLMLLGFTAILFLIFGASACTSEIPAESASIAITVTSTKTLHPTKTQTTVQTTTPTMTAQPEKYTVEINRLPEVFYSTDGQTASLSYFDHVEIINAETFEIIHNALSTKHNITRILNISPDGKKIIVEIGEYGAETAIFNTETNSLDTIAPMQFSVSDVHFSADSEYAIYHGWPMDYRSCAWVSLVSFSKEHKGGDLPFYDEIKCSDGQSITTPDISPDGKYAAAGERDFYISSLVIWNVEDKTIRYKIENLPARIWAVAFNPESTELASLSEDGHIDLWNPDTGIKFRTISSIVNNADTIKYSDDGSKLIITNFADEIYTYDFATNTSIKNIEGDGLTPVEKYLLENGHIRDAFFSDFLSSPDGSIYALLGGSLHLWDANTRTILHNLYEDESFEHGNIAFSPGGTSIAVITQNGNVYLWDVVSGIKLHEWKNAERSDFKPYSEYVYGQSLRSEQMSIAYSPDGSQIAINNGPRIEIWDIETGSMVKKLAQTSPVSYPTKISYSDDGKLIFAVLNENQDVGIWDLDTGKLQERLNLSIPHPDSYVSIALSTKYFARENFDGHNYSIEIWNLETKQEINTISLTDHLRSYKFTQDGKYLSANGRSQIYLWELDTGKQINIPMDITSNSVPNGINNNASEFVLYDCDLDTIRITFNDISEYTDASSGKIIDTPTPTPDVYNENGFYIGNADEYYDHSSDTYATQIVEPLNVPVLSSDAISTENIDGLIRKFDVGRGEILKTKWSYDGLHIHVISSTGYYLLDAATLSIVEGRPFPNLNVTGGTILADRKIQICGTTTDGMVEVRDALSDELLLETIGSGKAEISPNGKWLVYEHSSNMGLLNLKTSMPDHSMLVYISKVHPIFSPDSNSVAIIVAEDTIEIWDIPSGIQKQTINFDYTVDEVKFSDNGQYLIISQGRQAHFWDINKQEFYKEIDFANKLEGDPEYYGQDVVHSVAVNHKLTELAVNTEGRMIWHYDMSTNKKTGTVSGTDSIIHSMTYSPDDSQLLSVDENGRLTLWETRFWKKVATSNDFVSEILGTTWLQDGSMAAWSANRAITFNPESGEMINNVFIPESKIMDISADGSYIAGNTPHRISMYDLKSGTFLRRLPIEADFYFSTSVWGDHLRTQFYGANFSTDGKHFIAYGSGGIWMIDPVSGSVVSVPEMNYITCKGAISPDGEFVVYSYNEYMQGPYMIDFDTAEFVVSMEPAPVMMYSAEVYKQYLFSPDKKWVAELRQYYDQPALLDIHPTTTGRLTKQTTLGYEEPTVMAFNPDGSLVAVGFENGEVKIVDFESDEVIATIQAHDTPITAISFSLDGKHLITTDNCGHIIVWGME